MLKSYPNSFQQSKAPTGEISLIQPKSDPRPAREFILRQTLECLLMKNKQLLPFTSQMHVLEDQKEATSERTESQINIHMSVNTQTLFQSEEVATGSSAASAILLAAMTSRMDNSKYLRFTT